MKNKFLLFAALLSIGFFVGCNDETTNEVAVATKITADETVINAEIDATVDDVAFIAEDQFDMQRSKSAKTSTPIKGMLPLCATVTTILTNDIWTRTIDFGTEGCAMPNGNVLKGKMIISFSKDFSKALGTINYKLEGFYHNDKLVEGNKTISRELKATDLLAEIHPVTTHVIDLKVTSSEGKIYTRMGARVREMVEGYATFANWEDNVFKIWGNQTTNFPDGTKHSSTTLKTTPLLIKSSCKMPFPVSGIVELEKEGVKATLDYGNGDCDNKATMTTLGVSKEIDLKLPKKKQ